MFSGGARIEGQQKVSCTRRMTNGFGFRASLLNPGCKVRTIGAIEDDAAFSAPAQAST